MDATTTPLMRNRHSGNLSSQTQEWEDHTPHEGNFRQQRLFDDNINDNRTVFTTAEEDKQKEMAASAIGGATIGFILAGPLGLAFGAGAAVLGGKIRSSVKAKEKLRDVAARDVEWLEGERGENGGHDLDDMSVSTERSGSQVLLRKISRASLSCVSKAKSAGRECRAGVNENLGACDFSAEGKDIPWLGEKVNTKNDNGNIPLPTFKYHDPMALKKSKDNFEQSGGISPGASLWGDERPSGRRNPVETRENRLSGGKKKVEKNNHGGNEYGNEISETISHTASESTVVKQFKFRPTLTSPISPLQQLLSALGAHIAAKNAACVLTNNEPTMQLAEIYGLGPKEQAQHFVQALSWRKTPLTTIAEIILELTVLVKDKKIALMLLSQGIMDFVLFLGNQDVMGLHFDINSGRPDDEAKKRELSRIAGEFFMAITRTAGMAANHRGALVNEYDSEGG